MKLIFIIIFSVLTINVFAENDTITLPLALPNHQNWWKTIACKQPKQEGDCIFIYNPSYYYSVITGECEEFVYGGCNGNYNRFETKEICIKTCISSYLFDDDIK